MKNNLDINLSSGDKLRISINFKAADIIPEDNEFFMRLDEIDHFLKITYKN